MQVCSYLALWSAKYKGFRQNKEKFKQKLKFEQTAIQG